MKLYARIISPLFLLVALSLCDSQQAFGLCGKRSRKALAEQCDTTKSSAYDKFFKEEHRIARGLFTLHEMKGRVYFEIPLRLMDRSMLLGTTISATSDNGHGIVGSKPKDPLHFAFTRAGDRIAMRLISERTVTPPLPNHAEIERALATSNIGAIYRLFEIETFTPDSSAVVVDATDLFVSDDERLSPFDKYSQHTLSGRLKRKESFEKEKSYVTGIKSFSDNVSVSSSLNYRVTISERGLRDVPVTITATRSILLLDSLPASPRITDSRIAVFPTGKMLYSPTTQGARPIWYANRWRLEPSDMEAWKRGEQVAPIKPIVFYVDPDFPEAWKPAIYEGVTQWNELFAKIGFKDAVRALPYPEDDPEFDPDNIKYSCLRYAPIPIANAMGPSWVDPRSGEIINASVYVFHDVIKMLNRMLFVQTAQADERVRRVNIPDEVILDGLRYVLAHEVGHCLGFMHNMSSSAVIPVDSLRSPSFTQKFGTTTSIMDYARFNYVAQPGDRERGVKLTPPRFGVYDEYAVKWLYTPVPEARTPEEEYAITSRWITEASADPVYRYGKQQFGSIVDPKSQTEDLGDDAVAASEYGIRNLRYILGNLDRWYADGDDDYVGRSGMYSSIVNQYVTYIGHVFANIGGIYLNEKMEGDPVAAFVCVPREKQRRALQFMLRELKQLDWLDNEALLKKISILGSPRDAVREALIRAVVNAPAKQTLAINAQLAREEAYTPEACYRDVSDFVWEPTRRNRALTEDEMAIQREFLKTVAARAGLKEYTGGGSASALAFAAEEEGGIDWSPLDVDFAAEGARFGYPDAGSVKETVTGFGAPRFQYLTKPNLSMIYYDDVLRIRDLLRAKVATASGETRMHYRYLLYNLDKALDK